MKTPIITSLLDNDLYTFTVMTFAHKYFKDKQVKYKFNCRNNATFTEEMFVDIVEEIKHFESLSFTASELDYLYKRNLITEPLLKELYGYTPSQGVRNLSVDISNGKLSFEVSGSWWETVIFEVPVLAIVNEIYNKHTYGEEAKGALGIIESKKQFAMERGFPFTDFGTRRRYSKANQRAVIESFKDYPKFTGTSNVMFAKEFGLEPKGTMSHQVVMFAAGLDNVAIRDSQRYILSKWESLWVGSIALSDTYGFDAFLRDFEKDNLYKRYSGMRHDSGCPFEWARKAIQFYKDKGVDPRNRTLVFSDGLTMEKAAALWEEFRDQANITFGIGTHLTNDVPGVTPLQIVIKLVESCNQPVAKISDSVGKGMCECSITEAYIRKQFQIKRSI